MARRGEQRRAALHRGYVGQNRDDVGLGIAPDLGLGAAEMGGIAAVDDDPYTLARQGGSAGLAQAAGRCAHDCCQTGDT